MSSLEEISEPICPIGKQDSLLILSANFEDRTTAVVNKLADSYAVRRVAVWRSRDYGRKGNAPANFELIQNRLRGASENELTTFEFNMEDPLSAMVSFEKKCSEWRMDEPLKTVSVDVTTFPREQFFMLLRVLDSFQERPIIRLYYADPGRYGSQDKDGWLTRGVRSVRSVPGFGGIQQPRKKKLLLLFLGHEDERAAIVWKRHQAEKTIAIRPDPSYRKDLNGIVERTHHLLFSNLGNASLSNPVPARGINEAKERILEIWNQYQDSYFMVIAPLGTKLQALGIYEAARLQPSIQITYAVPSVVNFMGYSHDVGSIWQVAWPRA